MIGLALTFAALAATASAGGYIEGREYIYKYEGQVYTGFGDIKPQYSGICYYLNVTVQPHGDYAILKVDGASSLFNGVFENLAYHERTHNDVPAHADFLTRPFKVFRKNGIVTSLELPRDEPTYSVNLKRGVAYLFNLNLDETETGPSTEDNDVYNHRREPDSHFYKVYEEGLMGDCETAYVIEHHPYEKTPHNNIVLNVTKTRNYHKCNSRPNQVYSVFHGHECGQAEHEKSHTLHGSAEYYYDIRGSRHDYIIERIRMESEVSYTPYPADGQKVSNYIDRYVDLIAERTVTTPLELPGDLVSYSSLAYDFEFQKDFKDPVDLKKPHYLYHITGKKVPFSDIRHQVEELVQVYNDESYQEKVKERNFPAKFVELLRSVATLGYDEINDLYKEYADIPKSGASEEQRRYRNLFIDILVNLGTNPAILFGKELVESEHASPQEAHYFISQLPLHVKEVSEELLDQIQEFCEHDNVKKHLSLHIACVFTLSNIVYDHCVAHYHPEGNIPTDKHVCPREVAVKYFNYIARHFEETEDENLKTVYLKAAGNVGVEEIFPYVRPYIEGSVHHDEIHYRSGSIWALHNVGRRYPDRVRKLLIPLLFNHSENYELRLSAFTLLMLYRPEAYALESIARALNREPDDQVKSYIYSYFKHLANSTHVCDRQISQDVHSAISILEEDHHEFDYDYAYSKKHYYAGYDPHYDFGGATTFAYMASDTGYIPRVFYLGLEDLLGGKSFNTLGLGFRQQGLEKFLDKIIGPEGTLGRRSLFDLFKKREKRDASGLEKELNEIKAKLNLPVYDYLPIHGEFFLYYMGNHMSSLHFDDHSFEDFFRNGRFSIPNLPALYEKIPEFFYQRFLLPVDRSYVVPSESGLPLIFDYKQPIYYSHKNEESSFKVEPGFFAEERGGKYPDHVKLETDGHFVLDKNLFATVGIVIPFEQVIFGAGINRRSTLSLPLKLQLDLDVQEKQLTTHWTPVAPHEVFHFKYEPYTFVDSYANVVHHSLEEGYLPVRRVHRHEVERHFFHDALGVGFDVKADYENEFNDEGSWLSFLFEKNFREKFYYLYANPHFEPYHFDIGFSYAKEAATKQVETVFRYKFYDEEHTINDFSTEGFEGYRIQTEGSVPVYTSAIEAEVTAHGDKERTIRGELDWTRDLHTFYHKLNFFYDRSPFTSSENEHLKVCGSSYLKYLLQDFNKLALELDPSDMDHAVESELKVHFGKDCRSDQKIKVQGRFEESDEQRDFERRRHEPDTPEHYNEYSHLYHECLKEREQGIYYGKFCWQYILLATTVHKYSFHVKHDNLSPGFLNFTYKASGFLRHVLYNHADHNVIGVHNPDDELHLVANFSSKLPVADIRVTKPRSVSEYYNVYIPQYRGLGHFPRFEDIHIKNSLSDVDCRTDGDFVSTFDGYEYKLPSFDCYNVLAKDCSPNEHFTVLSARINHPKYSKAVKVFLGNHKVEVLPVNEDSDLIVRVDGKRVSVSVNEPYLHREEDDKEPLFYVTFRDFYYTLHSEKYGIIVGLDKNAVFVQTSPFYRAKLCGLCGNYNGQKFDGVRDSKGCYYEDDSAYAYSYAIPSDTCSVPKVERICPKEGGFGCTHLRTRVVELRAGKVPQTCFSTEPVTECADLCKARATISRQVSFHCLPSKDDSTKELLRQQQTRVIYEVRRKSRDHEATVEVPDGCYRE